MVKKKGVPEAFGAAIGGVIGTWLMYFAIGWVVMVAFSALHHDAPGVPALGYWACFFPSIAFVILKNYGSQVGWGK